MTEMGGMSHDEANGIGLAPGQTKELEMTLSAGAQLLAGCHVNGHYAAGMKSVMRIAP